MSRTIKIVRCKVCGNHGTTQAIVNYFCVFCQKRFSFKHPKSIFPRVIIKYTTDDGRKAAEVCAKLNGERQK